MAPLHDPVFQPDIRTIPINGTRNLNTAQAEAQRHKYGMSATKILALKWQGNDLSKQEH